MWDDSDHYPTGFHSNAMRAVLAIDTSTDACSVGFATPETAIEVHRTIPRAHNRHILAMIDEALAGRPLNDVDVFACGVGPGSFTGLRVAVSVVQGLAWSLDRPTVGLCSLEAQAMHCLEETQGLVGEGGSGSHRGRILSTIDAQIGQLYWRWFDVDGDGVAALGEPGISLPGELPVPAAAATGTGLSVIGSGCRYRPELEEILVPGDAIRWLEDLRPHALTMASRVLREVDTMTLSPAQNLLPRYVQEDIGWKKLAEQPSRD